MVEFYAPQLTDKPWVDACLAAGEAGACEYNFTNLFTWAEAYEQVIGRLDGQLLIRVRGRVGPAYLWPVGEQEPEQTLRQLEALCAQRGEKLRLVCLTRQQVEQLEQLRPGAFAFAADRDGFDYLYDIDKLSDLPGRKLHSKRNHCKRFETTYPDWTYEALTEAALPECLAMGEAWDRESREREGVAEETDLSNEQRALRLAMEHFTALGLEGGVLRVGGKVVAFTMGDKLTGSVFDVHFEKAYGAMPGAYAVINREFARQVRRDHPEVRFLNREDDMGVEGLRKAKSSYYPDQMVEKYWAVRKDGR